MAQELKAIKQGSAELGEYWVYDAEDVDAVLAEKDAEIQALKQKLMAYGDTNAFIAKENTDLKIITESKDAENRRLKRALWLARAELCHRLDVDRYLRKHCNSWYNENCLTWHEACVAMEVKMCKAESKCRAKAEEYR